jgi:hypothetical protein
LVSQGIPLPLAFPSRNGAMIGTALAPAMSFFLMLVVLDPDWLD